tara:strand:+ start:233 stop:361 length:129 start_codon:yes stop_codon:yes gene_type:complete
MPRQIPTRAETKGTADIIEERDIKKEKAISYIDEAILYATLA